ncbi:MAG TPA: hypothetical protein VJ279_11165 [Hanamia sp.]|nr:hypothetical protein [Hanamia sp.]
MKVKLHSSLLKKNFKNSQAIMEGILPFTETPSFSHFEDKFEDKEDGSRKEMKASDLFSLFTADIIKEEIVFTR